MSARAPAALAIALAASACGGAGGDPVGTVAAAIIGGAPTTGDPAVVLLVGIPADHATFDACTASLVAPDVLLTAAHCLDPATHPDTAFGVFPGPDATAFPSANTLAPELLPVRAVHLHPDYSPTPPFHADVAVAVLEAPLDVTPLAVQRDPLGADVVGAPARLVGYGQAVYGTYSAVKRAASTTVAALGDDDTIVVGDAKHRSCIGDSGGPAIVAVDGVERVVGVDSYTDLKGCLEPAHYRRTDTYAAFLAPWLPPSSAGGAGGGAATGGAQAGGAAPTSAGGGAPIPSSADAPASEGGCRLAPARTSASPGAIVPFVAALALLAARRRTSSRRAR